MRDRSQYEISRAQEQDDEEDELQPDDPLDAGQVDEGQEEDDDGRDGAFTQRGVGLRDEAGDGFSEASSAQGIANRLGKKYIYKTT